MEERNDDGGGGGTLGQRPRLEIAAPPTKRQRVDDFDSTATASSGDSKPPAPHFANHLRRATRRKHWAVIALILAYIGWFSYLSWKLYYGYGYPPFDLSIFDQGMWLLTHFHVPFVTVMGRNLFGDHTSFILLLFAPFYRLFPEPQGLLMLQTLAIACTAIPIYVLAQKFTTQHRASPRRSPRPFCSNPALEQGNMQQFHPEAFQVLIIAVAIYAAIESRGRAPPRDGRRRRSW